MGSGPSACLPPRRMERLSKGEEVFSVFASNISSPGPHAKN